MYTKPGMSGRGKHSCLEPAFPPLQPLHLPEKPELSIYTCKNLNIFTKLFTLIYKATLLGIDFSIHNLPSTINCLLSTFYCLPSTVYRLPSHRCPNRCPRIFRRGHQLDNQRRHTQTQTAEQFTPPVYINDKPITCKKIHSQVDAPTYFCGDKSLATKDHAQLEIHFLAAVTHTPQPYEQSYRGLNMHSNSYFIL